MLITAASYVSWFSTSSAFIAAESGAGLIGIALGGILAGLAGLIAAVAAAGLAIAPGLARHGA